MTKSIEPDTAEKLDPTSKAAAPNTGPGAALSMSKSMHDGVEVWCDCCSCEAEPYWVEAMQEEEECD